MALNNLSPNQIFFPKHFEESERIRKENLNFAYYASAETVYKLIIKQELWLRSITAMNDYAEFTHGKKLLIETINESINGKQLKEIFNALRPNLFDQVFSDFQRYSDYMRRDFQIMCVSEHDNIQDKNGKLSMWRAYGGNNPVAIVFKREFFEWFAKDNLDFSNVAYLEKEKLDNEIKNLNESILRNKQNLDNLDSNELKRYLGVIFTFAALCNKHEGFNEEKEWRLIAMGSICENNESIFKEVETIKGVPQLILKVKLESLPIGLKLKDMIEKVIIGPCNHPNLVYDSIDLALKSIGVEKPDSLIYGSDIPYRANF